MKKLTKKDKEVIEEAISRLHFLASEIIDATDYLSEHINDFNEDDMETITTIEIDEIEVARIQALHDTMACKSETSPGK